MTSSVKKVTVLGVHFDTGNMGVGALAMGVVTCINYAWPGAAISFMEYDDEPHYYERIVNKKKIGISLIPLRFSKRFFLANNIAFLLLLAVVARFLPRTFRKRFYAQNKTLNHLATTNVVASVAGGDSFSDIYGIGRFAYIVLPMFLVMAMKRNLVLMPQTIGPIQRGVCRFFTRRILRYAAMVVARDEESLVLARKLMGPHHAHRARFCYDMGILLEPASPAIKIGSSPFLLSHERPLMGLNVSGLLAMGGYTQSNMFAFKIDYLDFIRRLIGYMILKKKVHIVLVPHVFGTFKESDQSAQSVLYKELSPLYGDKISFIDDFHDQNVLKSIIGQCDFFAGSRMHACIAALSQYIPAIGIAYSRKFAGVYRSFGVETLLVDPREDSCEQMLAVISDVFDARKTWSSRLRAKMPACVEEVRSLLNELPESPALGNQGTQLEEQ